MDTNGIRALITKMALERKASLCPGRDFRTTKAIERLAGPGAVRSTPEGLADYVMSLRG